jgi:hypothetical protein
VKTQPWQIPPGFAEDPSLPAPVKPEDENFDRLPPEAALEGAPVPAAPVAPESAPAAQPAPAAAPAN